MRHVLSTRLKSACALALVSGVIGISVLVGPNANAADPLGLYVGASLGQGRVETGSFASPGPVAGVVPTLGNFKENHSAYKLMVGVRPISVLGAELDYIDFGHPSGSVSASGIGSASADVTLKGPAAFALLYLPIPVVDVYLKAGLARLQSNATVNVTLNGVACPILNPNCALAQAHTSANTSTLAGGIGAQFKFGSAAVRGEYERFSAVGGNPALFSVGITWAF